MRIKDLEQQIAQTVRLEDVVRRYAELFRGSKSGKTLRCDCLFHRDDSKSFRIKVTEQIYECCICKETGNVIDLVQSLVGCNDTEALYILADWFEIPIDETDNLVVQKNKRQVNDSDNASLLHSIHENRELNMILESLGYDVGNNPLLTACHKYLGLGVSTEVLPDKYERLAGAMLFPIRDGGGVLQGFLKYKAEEKGKECICYPPNLADSCLLGLYQAIKAIEKLGFVYLVWNYNDLLTMHIAGFTNTVACYNGSLTSQQIDLLLKYTNRVVLIHTSEVSKQVRATKTAARLSFASAVPYCLSLSKKNIPTLYKWMGAAKFEYFIRQSTRLVFLNALKDKWLIEQQTLSKRSNDAKSKEEKIELRSKLVVLRNKLDKLFTILDENCDYLCRYFE